MSDDADERERREAEALARALEAGDEAVGDGGDERDERLPEDALEAAALLRYGAHGGELRPERAEAVLAELLPRVAATSHVSNAPRRLVRFAPVAVGMLAAAAAVSLIVAQSLERGAPSQVSAPVPVSTAPSSAAPAAPPSAAGAAAARGLPAPPQGLLAAQAALAGDEPTRDRAAFEAAMHDYRERVLHALEHAYPARTGLLELRGRR